MLWSGLIEAALKAFFAAFGSSLNDFLGRKRAEQNSRDLGRAEAQVEHGKAAIEAQQRELEAQANAPRTVDDAIARLEDGSA